MPPIAQRARQKEPEGRHRDLRNASDDAIVGLREILEGTRGDKNRTRAVTEARAAATGANMPSAQRRYPLIANPRREPKTAYSIFRHIE